jgi:glycosyltransferase involved in cell wall biosynthesis
MRILYVTAIELDVDGGPKTHVLEILKQWHALGHEVMLLSPRFYHRSLSLPMQVRSYGFIGYSLARRLISYGFLLAALVVQMKRFRPEAVYERQMEHNPVVCWVCKLFHLPLFVEINGLIAEDLQHTGAPALALKIHQIVEAKELSMASGITCTSPRLREKICDCDKKRSGKTIFIPNGVNTDLFRPMDRNLCRKQMGLDPRVKYVGYVGTFNHLHNVEQVISSFSRLKEQAGDVKLLLVGDGPSRRRCEKMAVEYGIVEDVLFIGALRYEDVATAVNCFDVGLSLSSRMSLARVGVVAFKFFEYLACRCPVVAQYLYPEDWERYSILAKMVHVDNARGLMDAIIEIFSDPIAAAQMAQRGLRYVEENISWEQSARLSLSLMARKVKANEGRYE